MITTTSKISFERQAVPPIIPAVQGDSGRNILFNLTDYAIPDNTEAFFYIQKPSGNAVYNSAEIVSSGSVLVPLDTQCLAETGENYGQVRISLDGEIITSFDFILLVKAFRGVEAVESTTEMNIFDKAVEQAREEIGTVLDTTLTEPNMAAEAKATGEAIEGLKEYFASPYDPTSYYLGGDICLHNGKIYRCNLTGSSARTGPFVQSMWDEVTLGDAITAFVAKYRNAIAFEYSENSLYHVNSLAHRGYRLYRCIEDIRTPETWTPAHWQEISLSDVVEMASSSSSIAFADPNDDGNIVITIAE